MQSKFKIGDEIFFMGFNSPVKSTIQGVAFVIGKFDEVSFRKAGTEEEPSITYSCGSYNTVEENKAFATKQELIDSLFQKL